MKRFTHLFDLLKRPTSIDIAYIEKNTKYVLMYLFLSEYTCKMYSQHLFNSSNNVSGVQDHQIRLCDAAYISSPGGTPPVKFFPAGPDLKEGKGYISMYIYGISIT
jgi:hypothetical protein